MKGFDFAQKDFSISKTISNETSRSDYKLHNHENIYEILFFLKGDSTFLVEGTEYPLSEGDFVIARPDELHRVIHHSDSVYKRVVISFTSDFLKNAGCAEYEKLLINRPAGSGNLFRAAFAPRAVETLYRLAEYAEENAPAELIKGVLLEFFYSLSKCSENAVEGNVTSERTREIILFINNNLASPLSLDFLSEKFFISKYHLCRLFKTQTGFTIGKYITKKRLLLADSLHASGMSLTEAALNSGFGDYSTYWHAKSRTK